jgi:hypothetical protein
MPAGTKKHNHRHGPRATAVLVSWLLAAPILALILLAVAAPASVTWSGDGEAEPCRDLGDAVGEAWTSRARGEPSRLVAAVAAVALLPLGRASAKPSSVVTGAMP